MEAQLAFFDKGSSAVSVFKRPVSNYRAKFPKGKARATPKVAAPAKPAPVGRKVEDVPSKRRGTTPEPVVAQPQSQKAPRSPPQPQAPPKPASAEPLLDLDFGNMTAPKPAPTVPQQPVVAAKPRDDRANSMDQLLSFLGGDAVEPVQPKPQPIPENKVAPDPTDLSQLFGTFGGVSPNAAPTTSNAPQPDLLGFDMQPQTAASSYDPMNFGAPVQPKPNLSDANSANSHGMNINAGWGTNTRAKGLSAKEIQEIDRKVEEKLQEHQNRVQAEEDLIEAKIDTRDKTENMIKAWSHQNNVRRDLRTLLSTMQNVLWADSGWKPVGLTDLLTPKQIKRQYRKAIMVIHPDRQSAKSIEIQVVAAQVFEVINEAWGEFQKKPKQR